MFGSVPKNLWNKQLPGDEQNRVLLAQRSLVIEMQDRCILIDVGMGEKWNQKARDIYEINNSSFEDLKGKITDVILTHLHFDHAGGISFYDQQNQLKPTFPGATVHIQKTNLKNAQNPNRKERASYLPENVGALELYKVNELQGECEIIKGVRAHLVNGHTQGQQWIEIQNGSEAVFFATDLIPTRHHVHPAYSMGYDMCVQTLMKEKEEFLKLAVERQAKIVFQHDPTIEAAKIKVDKKGNYDIAPA